MTLYSWRRDLAANIFAHLGRAVRFSWRRISGRARGVPTMHSGEPKDSVRLRAAEMMGKHYGLFTDRLEAVVPVRSAEEITAAIEEKLQQYLLPEARAR